MGPGQSFGELALIDKKNTRTATIKSETDVVFLTLGTEQFKKSFMKIE
jgi:CRP-like cAMP-binding protein